MRASHRSAGEQERRALRSQRNPGPRSGAPGARVAQPLARMLALQRACGNAAAARLIQRKIGFEFEADAWHSWRRTKPVPVSEWQKPPQQRTLPPDAYEPMKKKDLIHRGDGFTLEADELKSNDRAGRQMSDIEFVTDAFDETPQGVADLADAMQGIAALAGGLTRLPPADEAAGRFNWYEDLVGAGVSNAPHAAMMDFGDRPLKVKMQASFGLRLDQIAGFMAAMGAAQPGESRSNERRRREGRELMSLHTSFGQTKTPGGMQVMGEAAAGARRACATFAATTGTPASASLEGLVSLVTLYIRMGEKFAASASYPKAIAALMARTDFAQMFAMLPQAEQTRLTQNNSQPWLDLVEDACGLKLDVPVLKGARVLQAVTRELWLEQMTLGVDVLSEQGFQALTEAMHPDITSEAFLDMSQEAPSLESMGAMGAKTEGPGGTAAIFELRSIPDMFAYTELPKIAAALAKYVSDLNRGKDVRYKR